MSFDENSFIAELTEVFDKNGLGHLLNEDRAKKLFSLTEILLCENEKYNLTAITEPSKVILHHYADCAVLAALLPENARIADIGCGAGFPTLPVAILRPDVKITGIDSTAKRIAYVSAAAKSLGCDNVTAIAARAEELSRTDLRESFDFATARAVAAMRVLAELALPFVKVGGTLIAMKGKNAAAELDEAKRAITTLGGKLDEVRDITLIGGDEELSHPLIFIKKVARTVPQYPRQFSKISKNPL